MFSKKTILNTTLSAFLAFSTTFTTMQPAQAFPGSSVVNIAVTQLNRINDRQRADRRMRDAMRECVSIYSNRQWQYRYSGSRRCKPDRLNRTTCNVGGGIVLRITSRQRLRYQGNYVIYRVNWQALNRCEDAQGDCRFAASSGRCAPAEIVSRGSRGFIDIRQQRRYERATFG